MFFERAFIIVAFASLVFLPIHLVQAGELSMPAQQAPAAKKAPVFQQKKQSAPIPAPAPASEGDESQEAPFRSTDLPLPRFVSLSADEVNARTGPGQRYPIRWIYKREGLPVEIVQEYENWRKVRDIDGEEGWVHASLLTGRRTGVVRGDEKPRLLFDKPDEGARKVAKVEGGVVVRLKQCENVWCEISAGGFDGWIEQNYLWGIYEGEELN